MVVIGYNLFHRAAVGGAKYRIEPIRVRLVGAEKPEVGGIKLDDVPEILSQLARRFRHYFAGAGYAQGILGKVRQIESFQQSSAVDMRIRAHPAISFGSERRKLGDQPAVVVE